MGTRNSPTSKQIRGLRTRYGLTQTEAAALVYSALRTWQEWEAGTSRMHPGLWELWKLKTATLYA